MARRAVCVTDPRLGVVVAQQISFCQRQSVIRECFKRFHWQSVALRIAPIALVQIYRVHLSRSVLGFRILHGKPTKVNSACQAHPVIILAVHRLNHLNHT